MTFEFEAKLIDNIPDDVNVAIQRIRDCNKECSYDHGLFDYQFSKLNNEHAISSENHLKLSGKFRANYEMVMSFCDFISSYIDAEKGELLGHFYDEDGFYTGNLEYDADEIFHTFEYD